jgi:transcriptional regulator with XRE-family HTH domain
MKLYWKAVYKLMDGRRWWWLADALGLKHRTLEGLRRRAPSAKTQEAIAKALGVPLSTVLLTMEALAVAAITKEAPAPDLNDPRR